MSTAAAAATASGLRPYQEEAKASVLDALSEHDSTLLVMATGTGKTRTASSIIDAWRQRGGRAALCLAHRRELVEQMAGALRGQGLEAEIEMADRRAARAGSLFGQPDAVVASVQSMAARCSQYPPDAFDLVVVDEAHHAVPGSQYDAACRHFAGSKRLGLTATPDRLDKRGLGGMFASLAFTYDIRQAIDDGWLVPIRQRSVEVEDLDFSRVRTTAGDFNEGDLDELMRGDRVLHEVAAPTVELVGDRSALVYSVTVAHAHAMAGVLEQYGGAGCAVALDGGTPREERASALEAFQAGEVQYLVSCELLTEGVDLPRAGSIVMARPTKSRALYTQCLDDKTEVLTDAGWLGIDAPLDGVKLAAFDPRDGGIRWSDAERVERQLGDEEMWGIESPHLSLRVTAGHRMVVRTRARDWHFREASQLPAEGKVPVSGCQEPSRTAALSDADLTFLGLLLSDGNYNPRNDAITIYQTDRYPAVVRLIGETLRACGFKYGHSVERGDTNFGPRGAPLRRWTISKGAPRGRDKHLTGWGRLAEWVSPNGKSLTPAYEALTRKQVSVLLRALHAGNGSKHEPAGWERRTLTISVANEALADQLQSLLVRRGYRCAQAPTTSKARMLHVGDTEMWSLVTSASDTRPTWGVVPSLPSERVWCVAVDTGAIIVRRKGKVAVVGNCVGRGLRLHETKRDCLVLDFVGNAGRHALVSATDILAPDLPPERLAVIKALAGGGARTVTEAIEEEAEQRRREALRSRAGVRARARYRVEDVDPFQVFAIERSVGASSLGATEKQAALLERAGVPAEQVETLSRTEASRLIDRVINARQEGLATYRQARFFVARGLDPKGVTFEEARRVITAIQSNGWNVPAEVSERYGVGS